jgi:heterotetrameric sarcosine oxidase delta subunit
MRIPCPFCGLRDSSEFVTLGEDSGGRPDPDAADAAQNFYAYAYLRTNAAAPTEELWYHALGCRSWLRIVRDPRAHDIASAALAREAAR